MRQEEIPRRMIMDIYVGQLPYNVNEVELKELFSEFGEIASVNLVMDRFSGRSKGFGFIEMPNNSEADKAIKALNKTILKGREIKVNQVQQQKKNKRTKRRPRY
jgi:RNA recognition motif-containing protein